LRTDAAARFSLKQLTSTWKLLLYEDAYESAVHCCCWLELDFQENVYGHGDEFEKVADFLATVQHNCLLDPNAPGSATGVPAADTDGCCVTMRFMEMPV
jgi:hypothetical protein